MLLLARCLQDIVGYCKTCEVCQRCQHRGNKSKMILIPIIGTPFRGYGYCWSITKIKIWQQVHLDSMWLCLVRILSRLGIPQEILTNQGTNVMLVCLQTEYHTHQNVPISPTNWWSGGTLQWDTEINDEEIYFKESKGLGRVSSLLSSSLPSVWLPGHYSRVNWLCTFQTSLWSSSLDVLLETWTGEEREGSTMCDNLKQMWERLEEMTKLVEKKESSGKAKVLLWQKCQRMTNGGGRSSTCLDTI